MQATMLSLCRPIAGPSSSPQVGASRGGAWLGRSARLAFASAARPTLACPAGRRAAPGVHAAAAAGLPPPGPRPVFPFCRVIGSPRMKLALMLNVIDPAIGGVLIMGDRGTGKSTAVRALTDLLPKLRVVPGDPFNSDPEDITMMGPEAKARALKGETLPSALAATPMVELPLGATEDRICGTIDIERALSEGVKAYEPGLLASANRGILYVDEVNLLDDSLVDVVLDSAASGWNTVEREGISVTHPAKFILIGSGNPEEGELRPQLLDRFGLSVIVRTVDDSAARTQMVVDRIQYEADPFKFCASVATEQAALKQKLDDARARLKSVVLSPELRLQISTLCSAVNIDGLRGDMVLNRAARALAAYEGRTEVLADDIKRVCSLGLNHRMRKDPMDPIDNGTKADSAFLRVFNPAEAQETARRTREEKAAADARAAEAAKAATKAATPKGAWTGPPKR